VRALAAPGAAGAAFNLAEPDPPRWNRFLAEFACRIGATPVRRIRPARLAAEGRLLAPALGDGRRLLRAAPLPDPIPPSLLRLFGQEIRLDPARADRVLAGWRETPLALGLDQAAAWFRAAA
jgi:hypothetical protein